MGMKIKDYFNDEYAQKLAEKCAEKYPILDKDNFILEISDHVEGKEYTQRLDAIVEVLGRYLPEYSKTLALFESMLGPRLPSFAVMYSEGIWLAPIGRYVEKNCADYPENFDLSVHFIEELTKRYTGEFAMRPLIVAFPDKSMKVLEKWSKSEDPYVRRLSSECMRVRLPWAKKMTAAVEQFEMYTKILGNLRYDENEYVQRSVANNLNDLYKYDREKAQIIVDNWLNDNPAKETLRMIHHGTRSLRVKR